MEPNKKFWALFIVIFSTLITFFNPVKPECVPVNESYIVKSLTPVFPPSNPPEEPDSPAQSPEPHSDKESPAPDPAKPPTGEESPVQSPKPPVWQESPSPAPATNPPAEKESSVSHGNLLHGSESPDLKSICSQTDFPPLCESAVNPLLSGQKPDSVSVLQLSIQASLDATKAAMDAVNKLTESDCKELYDDALTNLEEATNAVKSRDVDTVNTMLSAALTDYSTCNDGFEEAGEPNPVADLGDKLMKMASNCLAIATLVK